MTKPPDSERVRSNPSPATALAAVGTGLAVLTVVLLGLNLRLVFGSASALLTEIREVYQLGAGSAALLTTGPVVCLGIFAVAAARTVRRASVPTVITGCLVLVLLGTALRGTPWWPVLVSGTLLAGIGIAVANVLGPILVRLLFPHRIGAMTGLFTAMVSASAGIASGATIPLDTALFHNWRTTLVAWAFPAVLAVVALSVVALRYNRFARYAAAAAPTLPRWRPEVLRSPVAWAVTGFMGMQSLLAYSMIGWLPTIYRDRGLAAEHAGLLLTALSISSIATALTVPVLATRLRRQSVLAVAVVALSVAGLTGVLVGGTGAAVFWAVLLGLGQGGQLSLALTLINLRSPTASTATSLSSMAQSIGYLVAALGPLVAGALRGATGSWTVPLAALLVVMIPLAMCGWWAGRDMPVRGGNAEELSPT
ncbi:MAG: MFS transporter [Rhodococcus sp. (in: high G+C Gram-positive bacteria)]|uniref:MFS transporter n=1 Tax=Rhodococcus sp. TaxID=1831 RepID=UPI002AD605CD|nr:MFS transporter [Rhodococcus sp. (in: high G+C Gram-positive bacteria)]MDZ7932927.1 MFS transporter [Rhodococcus sp. (in: high G+C Gram-positive bacteria)]